MCGDLANEFLTEWDGNLWEGVCEGSPTWFQYNNKFVLERERERELPAEFAESVDARVISGFFKEYRSSVLARSQ